MTLRRTLVVLLVAPVATLLLAAGCGGGSEAPEVAALGDAETSDEPGSTTEASTDPEEAILAYTRCMREEGIDLPDPDFSGGQGGGVIRIAPGDGIDPSDPDFQAAQEACREHLDGIQGRFDPEERQALEDAALEFARCMREHGFDVPDPEFSEGGGGFFRGSGAEGLDPEDPETRAALEECQQGAFGDLRMGPGAGSGSEEDDR